MEQKNIQGALLDTRPLHEKIQDYKFEEMVSAINPVTWVEKPQASWRKFPIFNQDGSGSCVAQTMAKLLGIMYWLKNGVYVHFSATHLYQRRANKPSGGMGGIDVFNIAREGVTLEVLAPSQNMNDKQMDDVVIEEYKKEVGKVFKILNYVVLPIKDIETIASVIETTGKGVMIWTFWRNDEWTEVPKIIYQNLDINDPLNGRHSTSGVDFTLYEGEKAIINDDSWGSSYGKAGQRVLKESFFKERNFFAAYPINFSFEVSPAPFAYKFTKGMVFSENVVYLDEVKVLQDFLKSKGYFPTNIDSTGYYGAMTAKAVLKWQIANVAKFNAIDPHWTVATLTELAGHYFGNVSVQVANQNV